MIKNILLIGLGGGIGSITRYVASLVIKSKTFPFATLTVNLIGSFIIGLVFAISIKQEGMEDNWKLFLITGVCGGFTTFSAFSLENVQLLQSGKTGIALAYIIVSMVLGIAATFLGYQLAIKN
jgi:fluoride exporter